MKTGLILFITLFASTYAKSYENHIVVKFTIQNEEQLREIKTLEGQQGFTFIDSPEQVKMNIDLVMQPDLFVAFEEIATATSLEFKVATNNLQQVIDAEKPMKKRKAGFSLYQYNELEEIDGFLDETVRLHSDKASIFIVGESYEGRVIRGIKITTNENNPAIFIEANIHAREWISSATALWIINELLTGADSEILTIARSLTWYILPVLNVDGFKYTHDVNRLWRKTRSIHNILCRGADPNRNFGWNWRQGGSSNVACSDTYAGPAPFSEKESKALMDFYATVADKTDAYICFHSAAKMLMFPLGNTNETELVPNVDDLMELAKVGADALFDVNGVQYKYGNAMNTLYVTSGSSRDHAYGYFKTPLVFTYEMREGPENIFILPAEEIEPNSVEIFTSLVAIIKRGKELGYFQTKA